MDAKQIEVLEIVKQMLQTGSGGSITAVSVATANGLSGSSSGGSTPILTLNISALDATKIANGSVTDTEFQYLDGVTSAIQTQLNTKGATANPLSQFAATTSLQLLGVISDETGSGALVFGTSPTLTTPVFSGNPTGTVTSGTYTPTLTNVGNLEGSTAYQCQYMRVGNVVTVSGRVDINPTTPATQTDLGISLPIASDFTLAGVSECAGTASAVGIAGQTAGIIADNTNNRANMRWIAGDVTSQPMFFSYTYLIV